MPQEQGREEEDGTRHCSGVEERRMESHQVAARDLLLCQ